MKGRTLVHLAAENGRVEILDKLKEKGANMDEKDSSGKTPLYLAAKNDKAPAVEYLLQCPQVTMDRYQSSISPLDKAVDKGYRYEDFHSQYCNDVHLISANAEMLLKSS